jgi:hypothetical protein
MASLTATHACLAMTPNRIIYESNYANAGKKIKKEISLSPAFVQVLRSMMSVKFNNIPQNTQFVENTI